MKLAVIPARGGSKRIPRKNIKSFCGKPIIAYSIDAARATGLFDTVVVSTDDDEIADVARSRGADVPFVRPADLADDFTTTNAVVRHAIGWHVDNGQSVEAACCIYATAPFVSAGDIRRGYERMVDRGYSFAFSVTSFPFPIQRALRLRGDGAVEAINTEHRSTRSQDLEEAYHDAAQFYWGTARAYLDDLPLFAPHSVGVTLSRHLVQDIDTPEDWALAELMFKAYILAAKSSA